MKKHINVWWDVWLRDNGNFYVTTPLFNGVFINKFNGLTLKYK
jgi:hypothetical protein